MKTRKLTARQFLNTPSRRATPLPSAPENSPEPPTHTPGPWATSRDAVPEGHVQITVYAESTGQRVATVFDRKANAPLIAAAPDLLAAAKIGLACCIAWGGKCEAAGESILALESVKQAERIRAAIAKATNP